jgi:hypothetical protein
MAASIVSIPKTNIKATITKIRNFIRGDGLSVVLV